MWQITRDREVSPIRRFAASGVEVSDQTGVPVRLSIVLVSGIERAGPKWNSQNQVGRRGLPMLALVTVSEAKLGCP